MRRTSPIKTRSVRLRSDVHQQRAGATGFASALQFDTDFHFALAEPVAPNLPFSVPFRAGVRGQRETTARLAVSRNSSVCNLQFAFRNLQFFDAHWKQRPTNRGHAFGNSQDTPRGCRRTHPHGFTLVELLAALGISLLLIAAVSASLDIYARVTTTGQAAIERQQVARALLDRMTRDVASVVFLPAETEQTGAAEDGGESDTSDSSSGTTESDDSMMVEGQETAAATGSLGLIGDGSRLQLEISSPVRGLNYSPPESASSLTARTSDLLSVWYFLAEPGADGISGAVASLHAAAPTDPLQPVSTAQGPAGLARLEGDRMAMDRADVEQDQAALAAAANVIAPEIATLQFRYFDGQAWVDIWDSVEMGRLPQAIEVTLGFRDQQAQTSAPRGLSSVVPIGQTVRHVIHVPLAEPAAAVNAL